jgi:hypothetical protein
MDLRKILTNLKNNVDTARDASMNKNVRVLLSMLGPAVRGLILQAGKQSSASDIPTQYKAHFDWEYTRDQPEFARLYSAAKESQWNGETDLDWSQDVDPFNDAKELIQDEILPLRELASYRSLSKQEQQKQRAALLSWILSQFLHGEQGALFAACQVTEAVQWMDGKFYGSTQVVDEGRHVEVFHRYLTQKLGKLYQINDNLYVVIDSLMSTSAWDLKFLGMQIMVEGLALGSFGTLRASTKEPLLKELLKRVITDEARHVHYGVVALRQYYTQEIDRKTLQDREDWAFETALFMRNRFLAHEFYEEYYAHEMTRAQWDKFILGSQFMEFFRKNMFRRIVPNLKRINLMSERIRPHYASLNLLEWENERAADKLSAQDLLADTN